MNEPTNEEIQSALDAVDSEEAAAATPEGEESATGGGEAAKPTTYEIDGKQYTADQLREALKGTMRLEDYSREKNMLVERRQQFERERQEFIDSQRRPAAEEDETDDPLEIARQTQQRVESWIRGQEMRGLSDLYDQTFDKLCTKHGITDPEVRELYDRLINGANPEITNAKELVEKVTELFDQYHGRLGKLSKSAVDAEHGKLKKLPKPPSAKGEGAAPMATGEKPKKSFNDPISAEEIAGLTG